MQDLYAGNVDLMQDAQFKALMDTFDVLKEYNKFKVSPISVEDDQVHQALSEGEDAFQFGGCWEWNDIIDYDYTKRLDKTGDLCGSFADLGQQSCPCSEKRRTAENTARRAVNESPVTLGGAGALAVYFMIVTT